MHQDGALTLGGEFRSPERETAFRTARLGDALRQSRRLFILSAILNTLFLVSDWRFWGDPHFLVAVPARLAVVAASLACLFLLTRAGDFRRMQGVMIGWEVATGLGVALLVSSRSDLALFVVMLLPSIFYMVVPTSFRWTLAGGIGCSALMLAGYLGFGPPPATLPGLVLILGVLNVALVLVVSNANRLRRTEWAATQAERRAREELDASRAMIERLFMAVPIPLAVVSQEDGRFLRANDAARRFTGPGDLGDGLIDAAARDEVVRLLREQDRVEDFESQATHATRGLRDVVITATAITCDGIPAVVAGIVDITGRKAAEAKARRQATHDGLTGLPNRACFQERLDEALETLARPGAGVALFMIDLDDFKAVNDTIGHDAGDALLFQAASRLASALGPEDFAARLGGDEFVLLTTAPLTRAGIEAKAAAVLTALREPFAYGAHTMSPRASMGIALAPEHDRDATELMKDADLALYRAKANGRNTAVIYDVSLRAAMIDRVAVCRDVAAALGQDRILPFYQPQVCLHSGRITGFEALARWNHPERGIVSAGAFPQAFDDPDIAAAIGETIMRQVVTDMRGWLEAGLDFGRISVNLAPGAFRNPGMARKFLDQLALAGVPPARFGVEVTETVLLTRNAGGVEAPLAELRGANVHVALDDFGTGFASLTHLKRFPVDVIKIDRSFVSHVDTDAGDGAIVRAVLTLAHDLDLEVIAEGVETRAQEAFLLTHGCRAAQGFRYAKPAAASRVPWLLARPGLMPTGESQSHQERAVAAA